LLAEHLQQQQRWRADVEEAGRLRALLAALGGSPGSPAPLASWGGSLVLPMAPENRQQLQLSPQQQQPLPSAPSPPPPRQQPLSSMQAPWGGALALALPMASETRRQQQQPQQQQQQPPLPAVSTPTLWRHATWGSPAPGLADSSVGLGTPGGRLEEFAWLEAQMLAALDPAVDAAVAAAAAADQ
jgi:hypothetical protein